MKVVSGKHRILRVGEIPEMNTKFLEYVARGINKREHRILRICKIDLGHRIHEAIRKRQGQHARTCNVLRTCMLRRHAQKWQIPPDGLRLAF